MVDQARCVAGHEWTTARQDRGVNRRITNAKFGLDTWWRARGNNSTGQESSQKDN